MIKIPPIQQTFVSGDRSFSLSIPELQIEEGEITFVVGPNGSGKSLYLTQLSNCGSTGQDMCLDSDPRFKFSDQSVLIRQAPDEGLSLSLTVAENIALWSEPRGWRDIIRPINSIRAKFPNWEEEFPTLAGVWNQQASTLSGGQKQVIVALSRLLGNPRILLLDEVLSAIDERHAPALSAFILKYVEKGARGCLSVSHDLSGVAKSANRVLVFSQGQLAADIHRDESDDQSIAKMRAKILEHWP